MYMAVWGVLPHSNSIFYRIFVNYTSDFRHFPKNRRFASGGGWRNGAFVHFAVEVCRFGRRLTLPPLYPTGDEPQRHLLSLPRGRGPSQTPKFLSPGPPSPWLPALPIEWLFYRFCAELATPKAHLRRVSERHPPPRLARGKAPLRAPAGQAL